MLLAGVTDDTATAAWKLENYQPYLDKSDIIEWADVNSFTRLYGTSFNGGTYIIPYDGDFHFLHFRQDVLTKYSQAVPTDVAGVVEIAEALMASTMPTDAGEPDYGVCIAGSTSDMLLVFAADFFLPFVQTSGTKHGAFFDPETMDPLINNPGVREGMKLFKRALATGPAGGASGQDVLWLREQYNTGRCAMIVEWGDMFFQPHSDGTPAVRDNTKHMVFPGSPEVWERGAGGLTPCTPELCPHGRTEGDTLINDAPFAANGGWGLAMDRSSPHKAAAWEFLEWSSQPSVINEYVLNSHSMEPFRRSQLDRHLWTNGTAPNLNFTDAEYDGVMAALTAIMSHDNVALDLRVPGAADYIQVFFDEANKYLFAGTSTVDAMLAAVEGGWNGLTDTKYGRATQLKYYRMNLGIEPLLTVGLHGAFIVLGLLAATLAAVTVCVSCAATVLFGYIHTNGNFKLASRNFMLVINAGALAVTVGVAAYTLTFWASSAILCMSSLSFALLGLATVCGALFAKQFRIYHILIRTRRASRDFKTLTDLRLLPLFALFLPAPVALLLVGLVADPFAPAKVHITAYSMTSMCSTNHSLTWSIAVALVVALVLVPNAVLVFKTRKLPISETKVLMLTVQLMAAAAIVSSVIVLVQRASSDVFIAARLLPSVVSGTVIIFMAITYALKIWKAVRGQPMSRRDFRLLTGKGDASLEGYVKCAACGRCQPTLGNRVTRAEYLRETSNPNSSDGSTQISAGPAHSVRSMLSSAMRSVGGAPQRGPVYSMPVTGGPMTYPGLPQTPSTKSEETGGSGSYSELSDDTGSFRDEVSSSDRDAV